MLYYFYEARLSLSKLKNSPQKAKGFTIVELLIVIVIIGILAALVIVAYNGLQQRARNSQTVAVVNSYVKALSEYAIDNNTYPASSSYQYHYTCLSTNNPGGKCWTRGGNPDPSNPDFNGENASFNNAIKPYLGNKLPDVNPAIVNGESGIMFVNHGGAILDGQSYNYYIMYIMEGNATKCPVGQLLSGNWNVFSSTPPSSGYTRSIGAGTECWIKLPYPDTF